MTFIQRIGLHGLLSFPTEMEPIKLEPLNVLIGPNGSGKTNFIEALEILHSLPTNIQNAIQIVGSSDEWAWKGEAFADPVIQVDMGTDQIFRRVPIRYHLKLQTVFGLQVISESMEEGSERGTEETYLYRRAFPENAFIAAREPNAQDKRTIRELDREAIDSSQSILSQVKEVSIYPELWGLANDFSSISTFREWAFGTRSVLRLPQRTDEPTDRLFSDGRNLALVLNEIQHRDNRVFNAALKRFLPRYERTSTRIHGGNAQLFLHEAGLSDPIPSTRISDGTLRFLAILAMLLAPSPPKLLCIEEPELGMHPDAVALLADLLVDASSRMQLVVTTHSDVMLSALNEQVESVVVCENLGKGTNLKRLESDWLAGWLEEFRLGDLWRMGELGGNP